MGSCVGKTEDRQQKHLAPTVSKTDYFSCEGQELPKLSFQGILANIKVHKNPYKSLSLRFHVQKDLQFVLAEKTSKKQETLKWETCENFTFDITEPQLKNSDLQIQFRNQNQTIVAIININLYLICTGPYHQDFAITFKNSQIGRISFDLRICQVVEVKIQSIKAEIDLVNKYPGEKFCYSIKTIIGHKSAESVPSYPAMVLFEKKIPSSSKSIQFNYQNTEQEEEFPPMLRRNSSKTAKILIKEIQCDKNLQWVISEEFPELPEVKIKTLASEIHNTYFQILIWKLNEKIPKEFPQNLEIFAQCYVSFHKMFGIEASSLIIAHKSDNNSTIKQYYQERKINMVERLWRNNKQCGNASFIFNIQNEKYVKQHQICVRTENGILKTFPIFGVEETKTSQHCSELSDLLRISQQIQSNIIQLDKLQSFFASNFEKRRKKIEIEEKLFTMLKILEKSNLQKFICFTYSNKKQLIKAQKIFIEIGIKITQYLQEEDPLMNDRCWEILTAILKREELTLNHLGFSDIEKKLIQTNQLDQDLKKKEEVGCMFKLYLYKLLELALNSLNFKGSESQRTFAEIFCAYSYFRIPQFRKEILNLITNENDPEITEWRGIEFNLHDDIATHIAIEDANTFSLLFDWENNFYKYLIRNENFEESNINLNDILSKTKWRQKFISRDLAFFTFITYWVTYVTTSVKEQINKDIQWRYFPGYNRILKGFFVEMKTRSILNYPDSLLIAGIKLLSNQKLLNAFISILFNKTNVYESSSVIKTLEFINDIFTYFSLNNKNIPITFNYQNFFKGIKIILESQHAFTICSALTLLYTHFKLFHIQFRKNISMYLLGKGFFKLFLHWSDNVQNIFCHLMVYKIYHKAQIQDSQNIKNQISSYKNHKRHSIRNQFILQRYQKLLMILENTMSIVKKEQKSVIQVKFDKELHTKMKMKLYQKRRKRKDFTVALTENIKEMSIFDGNFDQFLQENVKSQFQSQRRVGDSQSTSKQQKFYGENKLQLKTNHQLVKNDYRHSTERIIKPKAQKYHSDTLAKSIALLKKQTGKHEQTDEKISNKHCKTTSDNGFMSRSDLSIQSIENIENNLNKNSIQISMNSNQFPIFQQSIVPEKEFDLKDIEEHQQKYLEITLKRFYLILDQYKKNRRSGMNMNENQPIILSKEAIDKRQIRPDNRD